MSGNTAFALVSVAVLVTIGLGAALTQFGLMIYAFGKWGFIWTNGFTGAPVLFFLSDMFVLNPGLAYAWAFAITPSVAIAVTIINTSLARDRLIWNTMVHTCKPPYDLTKFVWVVAVCAQWGLALLAYFDLHNPSGLHYLGVGLFGVGGVVLNFWVVFLDYGIERATWHPAITFDRILTIISLVSLSLFVLGTRSLSAASEWVVLLVMITLHALLPIRGARVVLSQPQIWYNSYRTPLNPSEQSQRASREDPVNGDTLRHPKETVGGRPEPPMVARKTLVQQRLTAL
ncbi:hypothetical protein T484DRAFT_1757805 [Baffinella frigidus]|nr:hypothetical protein T484DRAFT_1757805 [Cryptophyta sp. CCMP2293]